MIDTTFDRSMGEEGVQKALRRICTAAEKAIGWGYQMLVRPPPPAKLQPRSLLQRRPPA